MPHLLLTRPRRRPAAAGAGVALIAGLGALVIGCSRESPQTPAAIVYPASLLAEPAKLTLTAGHDAWIAAQANDTAGQPIGGAQFRFSAADPRVLHVSATGHVTALGPASAHTAVIVASGRQTLRVPVIVLPGAPQRLERVSGDDQQLRAGEAPAAVLEARVVDQWNNPIGKFPLTAESTAGLFPASTIVSAMDGIATFHVPQLTHAGASSVMFKGPDHVDLALSFRLHVAPGPAASIDEIPAATVMVPAATAAPITLRVTDAYGNPVPDLALTARTSKPGGATLTARTDAAGVANFLVSRQARMRRITLKVESTGQGLVRRSFSIAFDAQAKPSNGRLVRRAMRHPPAS